MCSSQLPSTMASFSTSFSTCSVYGLRPVHRPAHHLLFCFVRNGQQTPRRPLISSPAASGWQVPNMQNLQKRFFNISSPRGFKQPQQQQQRQQQGTRVHFPGPLPDPQPNRARAWFIWGIIGANLYVWAEWQSARQPGERASALADHMLRNYAISPENLAEGRWWTLATAAFSHVGFAHLAVNMVTFHAMSTIAFAVGLGPARVAVLAGGSALAGSVAQLLSWRVHDASAGAGPGPRRPRYGLGASGLVSGLTAATALMRPSVPMLLMGIVPVPLWILAVGYLAYDTYMLESPTSTTGHAAHLGGTAFGVLYYLLRLRFRFGGVI